MSGDDFGSAGSTTERPYIDAQPTSEEKTWAMLCHASGFLGYLPQIPFGGIVGPLVVWLVKKDSSQFVDEHGKEAINFQITLAIAVAINWILFFSIVFSLIAFALFPLLGLWNIVLVVIASLKGLNGEPFRYPLTIRFLR